MNDDQMQEAMRRQMTEREQSLRVDRTGWTRQQWIDDARKLMDHPDGAVTSLVNGHVIALLDEAHAAGVIRAVIRVQTHTDPCPACTEGKHQNCTEVAFDADDFEVLCPCMAHDHGRDRS